MASVPVSAGFSWGAAASFVAQIGVSYTLNRFMQPDGPRLTDLSIAGGDYGVPMARIYGARVRVTCAFIAQDDIKETKHSTDNTAGILIGAGSGALSGFSIGTSIGGPLGGAIGAGIGAIVGGLFGSKKHHYYTYSDTFACLIADRTDTDPIEGVLKVWAAGRVLFDSSQQTATTTVLDGDGRLVRRKYGSNRYLKSLTIYGGGITQTPDPVLEAAVGEQPAYRRSAYIVIEDLQLADFGNAVPAPIEVLAIARTGETLADVAGAICSAAGIDAAHNLSTTALAGQEVRGYAVTSEATCWDALSPLMPVFQVDAGDVNGQVRFYAREQGLRATIPLDALGAHEYGDSPPDRLTYVRSTDIGLPRETAFTFVDPARDYQPNTATSRRSEGDARSNVATTLSLTLSANEGATAAATMHWDAWLGRTALTSTLTDAWNTLTPGVCFVVPFLVPDDPTVLPYRLTRAARGANGIIEIEMVSAENVVVQGVSFGADVPIDPDDDTAIALTRAVFIDMPMLQDVHDDFGYYIAVGSDKPYWAGGRVEMSVDGAEWGTILDVSDTAVIGDVVGTLPGTTLPPAEYFDPVTVLTVELTHSGMTLSDATEADIEGWKNFAYVGKDGQGEYLQFMTATQVGPTTWELTDLWRGRRGTSWALNTHTAGEEFALLNDGGVYRMPFTNGSTWGEEYTFRAVSLDQDADEAAVQTFANTGEAKKPFAPSDLMGSFDGGGDLTLTWERQARFFSGELGTDAPEAYEVDILKAGVVVRTIDTAVEEASYSAADQTSDGFVAGQAARVRVYQVNTDYGRGHVCEGVFRLPGGTSSFDSSTVTFDSTLQTMDDA